MSHIWENLITIEGSNEEIDEFLKKHYKEDGRIDFATFNPDYAYLNEIYEVEFLSEYRLIHLQELYLTPKIKDPKMIAIYFINNKRSGDELYWTIRKLYPTLQMNFYAYFFEQDSAMWIENDNDDLSIFDRWESLEDFCDTFGFDYDFDDEDY